MQRTRAARALLVLAFGAGLTACTPERRTARHAPRAEFLVAAADSTFWVRSAGGDVRARGSAIQLARLGGRFYEVYTADDDRSYYDAVLVGERVYRRDLIRGDSLLVFDDTAVASLARQYAREHPREVPLRPDEDASEDPKVNVVGEVAMLEQIGPYLSVEYRVDGSTAGSGEWYSVRRRVVDLRTGRAVALAELFGDSAARRVLGRGAALFSDAIDSVLASRDSRSGEAVQALRDFTFDSAGFALVVDGRSPAVEFAAASQGHRAGGVALTLDPIRAARPAWWANAAAALPLPSSDTTVDRWRRGPIAVEARYDSSASGSARLVLVDSAGRDWVAARIPGPARRLFWLDGADTDSVSLRALARAFDEAALYSDDARTALRSETAACCAARAAYSVQRIRPNDWRRGAESSRPRSGPRTLHAARSAARRAVQ